MIFWKNEYNFIKYTSFSNILKTHMKINDEILISHFATNTYFKSGLYNLLFFLVFFFFNCRVKIKIFKFGFQK